MFGGGVTLDLEVVPTVDAYSEALVRSTPMGLSTERTGLAATTVGNYALFGGGAYRNLYYYIVDAYSVDWGGSQSSKTEPPDPGTTDPDGPEDLTHKYPGGSWPDKTPP